MGKKILLGLLLFFVLVFAALALVPILFKDNIKQALDQEIKKKVNANVFYNADKFGLSIFSNFPNLTIELGDFGVVNKAPFEGDTLLAVKQFKISLDIFSVIGGGQIGIKQILLDQPRIRAFVLPDGKSNWDITIADSTAVQSGTAQEPSKFDIEISKWEIKNGFVAFNDLKTPMFAKIEGFNHTGSGDFSNSIVDLKSNTTIDTLNYELDSVMYFSRTKFAAKLNVKIDQAKQLYTLADNELRFNDFALGFEGNVQLKPEGNVYDLKYSSKDNSFKSLLSLIPTVFLKGYEELKTEGVLSFGGFVKGQQTTDRLPQLGFNLKIDKGQMQYPKLPSALTDVNIAFSATHPGGPLELIETELKSMHFKLGKNPFDARLKTKGIQHIELDGSVVTKLDLAEVTQAFPVQGLNLKGLFSMDAKAKGVYDQAAKLMPAVSAKMELIDGYVQSANVPAPIEQLGFSAHVMVPDGKPELGTLDVERLKFVLEGEAMEATAKVSNLIDYSYDATIKGKADLGKLTKIYPLQNMTISGKFLADIKTSGNKAAIDAKRWDKLPTTGTMGLEQFTYSSPTLLQKVTVSTGAMTVAPNQLTITTCQGKLGSSDYALTGTIQNYLAFMFSNGNLGGKMNLSSPKFLANEWIAPAPATPVQPATPTQSTTSVPPASGGISVPKNLDIILNTNIATLLYDKYVLEQFTSTLFIKDGKLRMEPLAFRTLDGMVKMNGVLDPSLPNDTKFTYNLDVKSLSIPKTYTTVSSAQKMAPFLSNMTGLFSTNMKLSGGLDKNLSPDPKTLSGTAEISLNQAAVNNLGFASNVNSLAKTSLPTKLDIKDQKISAVISDGFVNFKPFDLGTGTNKVNVSGRYGLDGTQDYHLKVNVPSGQAGALASGVLAQYLGGSTPNLANLLVDIKVGGTFAKPTYSIAGVTTAGGQSTKDVGKAAFDKVKQEAEAKARQEADRLKAEAENKARQEADKLKNEVENKAKQELEKLKGKFKF